MRGVFVSWVRVAAVLAAVAFPASAAEYPAATAPDVARTLEALPPLAGAGLFSPSGPSPQGSTAETPASAVLRERTAAVDPGYLDAIIGAQPLALDAGGAVTGEPQRITLNLFDDLTVTAVKLSESRSPLGPRIIRAAVMGGGYATLVIDNGQVTADITAGGRQVMVRPTANGLHRIAEAREPSADDIKRKPALPPGLIPPRPGIEKPGAESQTGSPSEIRILIIYTRDAKAALTSVRATIALMMDTLNTTLANSGVNATATLAGIDMFRDTDAASVSSDVLLDHMRDKTGDFARIETLRAAVGADLVSMISAFDEAGSSAGSAVCGRGWLNDDLDDGSSLAAHTRYGGSVISTSPICLANLASSFAHEVGHNLGASHDRFTDTTLLPGPGFYAAGYVDLVGKFRDTMSYSNKCTANNVTCTRLPYYSNPNLAYNGRPLGIADSQADAADASRRIAEMAPYVARFHQSLTAPAAPVLSMVVSGTGTITSNPSGIDCGDTCSAPFTANTSVTLTATAPTGWGFKQWSGACTGAGACTVAMATSQSVTAVFLPTVRIGPVFSTAQGASQSFIRLINTGSSAGTATVKLSDTATGALLGTWTSPSIPAGSATQFGISTIESVVTAAAKPQYYAVAVQTDMSGAAQHVLWKPSDGTLTNLSTCDTGISAGTGQVASVHSSVLNGTPGTPGYPSSIAINNANARAASGVTLGIYDARNGTKLGTYAVASIPANGKLVVAVSDIEAAARITPTADMFHYVIKAENAPTPGFFLQHLVNNQFRAVTTDMTTVCRFDTAPAEAANLAVRAPGPLYSSAQADSQSFLRFTNTGTTAGAVALTLRNATSGAWLGRWTSASIPPGAARQFAITEIEQASGMTAAKPQYYTAMIESQITGSVAHVLWKPKDGTLTNLSTCDAGVSSNAGLVASVHSSLVGNNYPSTVALTNTGPTSQAFTLAVLDARDGSRLGVYTTTAIPAGGQALIAVAAMEAALGLQPTGDMFHYVVRMEGAGSGFLQHLVNNVQVGVITDMTTVCQLPVKAVNLADCSADNPTSCAATLGGSVTGQIKQPNSYQDYEVRLTAGAPVTVQVKGTASGNGTLQQPYVFIYSPRGGSAVAQGGGGGSSAGPADALVTFTPTTSGIYTVRVATYIFDDSAGTFVLTLQ